MPGQTQRTQGNVAWFSKEQGSGLIRLQNGIGRIGFSVTSLHRDCGGTLVEGEGVEFTVAQSKRRRDVARNVRLLSPRDAGLQSSAGTVSWVKQEQSWGFIRSDDGAKLFFQFRSCQDLPVTQVQVGLRVTCEAVNGIPGPRATNVRGEIPYPTDVLRDVRSTDCLPMSTAAQSGKTEKIARSSHEIC